MIFYEYFTIFSCKLSQSAGNIRTFLFGLV